MLQCCLLLRLLTKQAKKLLRELSQHGFQNQSVTQHIHSVNDLICGTIQQSFTEQRQLDLIRATLICA